MKTKFLSLLLVLLFTGSALLAHPPGKPKISYNKTTGDITITISHPVKNASNHYLDLVWVSVDGEETIFEYDKQTSLENHKIVINMPGLETGTKIKVKSKCNYFGKKKGKYKVE